MNDTFLTQINDNPCYCRVIHYRPYVPSRHMHGAMEDAEDSIDSEFVYELLDMNKNPMTILTSDITKKDTERLQDEYEAFVTAEKYGKDF